MATDIALRGAQLSSTQVATLFLCSHRGATRSAYTTDLKQWFSLCEGWGVDPFSAFRAHVDAWARSLEEAGSRPATIARKISSLRSFYAYAVGEGFAEKSPVPPKDKALHLPKVSKKSQTLGPDKSEAAQLLRAAEERGARDEAIVSVLLRQGLRVSELTALDLSDIRRERGHRVLALKRKGGEEQDQALNPAAGVALDAYLAERGSDAGPLFQTPSGGRMSRFQVYRVLKAVAAAAGLPEALSPHGLRHACVTLLLDAGVPIREVQVFVGHANSTTTERYDLGRRALDRSPAYAFPVL